MVTLVSNLAVFSDITGHGNQSHLVYAVNQQRWWLFYTDSKTATAVKTMVSSSADLATATWSAGAASPAFPTSRAMSSNDQRNLGVLSLNPGSSPGTDAVHVSVGIGAAAVSARFIEEIRATITGSATISWDAAWVEATGGTATWDAIKGNAVGLVTDGKVHVAAQTLDNAKHAPVRIATNADVNATWTNAWNAIAVVDTSSVEWVGSFAFATLASGAMLCVYDNGAVASPNTTNLRYQKYASGTTWPTTGSGDVFTGAVTQDKADWCLCRVDGTHAYAFRRSGASTFDWRVFDGTSWATPANGVPNQATLAGGGLFAATDGTDLYLFALDSASNNPVQYCKASGAGGATPTWGAWTQLEAAGTTARDSVSGHPVVANNQVGVIYTAVNGANFDIALSSLSLAPAVSTAERSLPNLGYKGVTMNRPVARGWV